MDSTLGESVAKAVEDTKELKKQVDLTVPSGWSLNWGLIGGLIAGSIAGLIAGFIGGWIARSTRRIRNFFSHDKSTLNSPSKNSPKSSSHIPEANQSRVHPMVIKKEKDR